MSELYHPARTGKKRSSLEALAKRHGTDKYWHRYCPFYDEHFTPLRDTAKKVMEIGIFDGASLRLWLDYFANAQVFGLDSGLYGTLGKWPASPRCHPYKGDQGNRGQLASMLVDTGGDFDLILDDGSHTMKDQQVSLACLFPAVRPGGFYVIEDLHTSFLTECCVRDMAGREIRYPTGASAHPTTFELVQSLKAKLPTMSLFMGEEEWRYIVEHTAEVIVYDQENDGMDGNPRHITALIRKAENG